MPVNVKDQEMLKLNELIKLESYTEAKALIKSFNHPQMVEDFNNGYLHFKMGDLVQSRLFLERAKYNGMLSTEVEEALTKVKSKLEVLHVESEISQKDSFFLESVSLPLEFFPSIFLVFLLASGICIWKKLNWLSMICVSVSLIAISSFFVIKDYNVNFNMEETVVYRGPSRIFEEVQILPSGAKFIISKEVKDWKYIKYPSIYEGWVYQNKALNL